MSVPTPVTTHLGLWETLGYIHAFFSNKAGALSTSLSLISHKRAFGTNLLAIQGCFFPFLFLYNTT